MKVLLALAIVLMHATAQAAPIACTSDNPVFLSGGIARTATFLCSPGTGAGAGSFDDNLVGDGWGITSLLPDLELKGGLRNASGGDLFTLVVESAMFSPITWKIEVSTLSGRAILPPFPFVHPTPVTGQPDVLAPFTVTVTPTDVVRHFGLTWSTSASYEVTAVQLSPVPEPQAYLMLLLGLGVMAGVARKRRAASAA